jgi:hypothetical protein
MVCMPFFTVLCFGFCAVQGLALLVLLVMLRTLIDASAHLNERLKPGPAATAQGCGLGLMVPAR